MQENTSPDSAKKVPVRDDVVLALKTVFDPEIPVDIYELGLIYEINIDGRKVAVKMTLTAPNCPIADDVVGYQIRRVEEGIISVEQFLEEIKFHTITIQYLFATPKAINLLQAL